MISLWRISAYSDLRGEGGEIYTARWHTAAEGRRIVYLAEHPALSLLEVLVNMDGDPGDYPDAYQLIKVIAPDVVSLEILTESALSKGWRARREETQFLGNAWLSEGRSALLAVPSAPSPESTNYLLNPRHPDAARLTIEWARWIEYDKRLFRTNPHST